MTCIPQGSAPVRHLVHMLLFLWTQKVAGSPGYFVWRRCGSNRAGATPSPHFKEIPAAPWTYNFGLSVPQLGGRRRFIGVFHVALRPVCARHSPA